MTSKLVLVLAVHRRLNREAIAGGIFLTLSYYDFKYLCNVGSWNTISKFELAFKCKEYALRKGYSLISQSRGYCRDKGICFVYKDDWTSEFPEHCSESVALALRLPFLAAQGIEVQAFHLLACPGCLAQKLQAGTDAGVHAEAAQRNVLAQAVPAVVVGQVGHHAL